MASVDTSIYSQLIRPAKSVAEYDAEARAGRMAELDLANAQDARAAAQQTRARAAGLDTLLRANAGATDLERLAALSRGGYLSEAAALRKSLDESGKTQSEAGKVKAETRSKEYETGEKKWQDNVRAVSSFRTRDDVRNHLVNLVEKAPADLQEQHLNQARAMLRSLDEDPDGLPAWQQRQLEGLMSAGDQMKYRMPDANAKLGAETTRRGQDMTQQTAREGQATTRRGQDLTYKAAAGANDVAREQTRALRDIQIEKGRGEVAKQQEEASDRASAKVADAENLANQIEVVKTALSHPGRTRTTGVESALGLSKIPGTASADFNAILDQIKGSAFLEAFKSLKGGGAITEIEGQKAQSAIARLSTAQSDEAFEKGLGDLLKVMESRQKRLANMPAPRAANVPRSGAAPAPAAAEVDPAALADAMNKYLKPGGR